jgi:hypothetical protein
MPATSKVVQATHSAMLSDASLHYSDTRSVMFLLVDLRAVS